MTLQEVRNFLDACHEVSHIFSAFPDLPKGLSPRHIKALQAIHELQTEHDLPAGANPPAEANQQSDFDPHIEANSDATTGTPADSRVKISDVSDFLGGTRPSVTKLIRELESCGALIKTPDTSDRRIIWVQLTPLGEEYYNFYCLRYHAWLSEVLGEIPQEDFETTIQTIFRVQEILQDNPPPKP